MSKISQEFLPFGNIVVKNPQDLLESPAPGGGVQIKYDYNPATVRLLKYPSGAEIPRHKHDNEALHIIARGVIESRDGAYKLEVGAMYNCGQAEYGPWKVLEDLEMYVIQV